MLVRWVILLLSTEVVTVVIHQRQFCHPDSLEEFLLPEVLIGQSQPAADFFMNPTWMVAIASQFHTVDRHNVHAAPDSFFDHGSHGLFAILIQERILYWAGYRC